MRKKINYLKKTSLYSIIIAIGIYSFMISISTILASRWVPTDTASLSSVGVFDSVNGNILRKLINDSLWLPPIEKKEVFDYDYIYSNNGTTLLNLDGQTKVLLKEKTMIFIKRSNDGFDLKIKTGSIDVEIGDIPIKVTTVDDEEIILDQKDMNYTVDKSQRKMEITENKKTTDDTEKNNEEADKTLQPETVLSKSVKKHDKPYNNQIIPNYPWPATETHFLYQKRTSIHLIPIEKCLKPCTLEIKKLGKTIFRDSFSKEEQPHIEITLEKGLDDKEYSTTVYEWTLTEKKKTIKGKFYSSPFSTDILSKLIRNEANIHILQ